MLVDATIQMLSFTIAFIPLSLTPAWVRAACILVGQTKAGRGVYERRAR